MVKISKAEKGLYLNPQKAKKRYDNVWIRAYTKMSSADRVCSFSIFGNALMHKKITFVRCRARPRIKRSQAI